MSKEPSALDIVLDAAKSSLNKFTPSHPDKVRDSCDIVEKMLRPHISQCCRQDEDGELVDKSEYSDSDITLAVIDDDGVYCMECRNKLYSNTHGGMVVIDHSTLIGTPRTTVTQRTFDELNWEHIEGRCVSEGLPEGVLAEILEEPDAQIRNMITKGTK